MQPSRHLNLNYQEIAHIVGELNLLLDGALLNKVRKGFQTEYIFEFYKDGIRYYLVLGLNPNLISLHLASKGDFYTFSADAFTLLLRKKIQRQRLLAFRVEEGERIVTLNFANDFSLKVFLFSKGANLILEEHGKTLLALRKTEGSAPPAADFKSEESALDVPAERLYAQVIGERYARILRERLGDKLNEIKVKQEQRRVKQLKRKIANLEMDLAKTGKADLYHLYGSVIYAYHSHAEERGLKELSTMDLEGNPLIIPLDPKMSIKDNAERFFKLSKKLKKGAPLILKRIEQFKEELKLAKETAPSQSIDNLLDEERENKKKNDKDLLGKQGFISYKNPRGFRITVGRNADENEALYRLARGRDFWLHNRDYPGGYVVIQRENMDPDPDTIQDAAQLALLYSSSKKQGEAYVMVSRVKYLSKSPGSPKGMINVSRYKSLWVRLDQERLNRLEKL